MFSVDANYWKWSYVMKKHVKLALLLTPLVLGTSMAAAESVSYKGTGTYLTTRSVLPLAGGSAVTVKMVLDLAHVYRQEIDADTVVRLLGQLGKSLVAMILLVARGSWWMSYWKRVYLCSQQDLAILHGSCRLPERREQR